MSLFDCSLCSDGAIVETLNPDHESELTVVELSCFQHYMCKLYIKTVYQHEFSCLNSWVLPDTTKKQIKRWIDGAHKDSNQDAWGQMHWNLEYLSNFHQSVFIENHHIFDLSDLVIGCPAFLNRFRPFGHSIFLFFLLLSLIISFLE